MKRKLSFLSVVLLCAFSASLVAAENDSDGRDNPFHDALLDNLAGDWHVDRKLGRGRKAENTLHAEWVLNHQFMLLHYRDVATPSKYEAMVFIGYDNASERYVVHWIDVFGGRFSETLGYGKREEGKNAIHLVFEYPDGPFHNTFTFDPESKTWTSLLRQKEKGQWSIFAEDKCTRVGFKK
jgi:uncharacterized protein DUF1579